MQTKEQAFAKLTRSSFRSGFHLSEQDRRYIREKGFDTIRMHAKEFIRMRLAPAFPSHDGRQTPWKGHPVFRAQHACACCCRSCLEKWYRVPKGVPLTEEQQNRIVCFLMSWIEKEYY